VDLIKTLSSVAQPPPAAESSTPAPAAPPLADVIYQAEDRDITPPAAISQNLPRYRPSQGDTRVYDGALILVVDENGNVSSATTQGGLQPAYELQLLRAASQWKFRPATKDGHPVKYRRSIAVRLTPPQ
jgi:hypothetical protein